MAIHAAGMQAHQATETVVNKHMPEIQKFAQEVEGHLD